MKLQGLSVIFCLIVVPIVLILSYYVHAQITTITTQMSYNTKLLDATHDAMSALELNTANENLSSVSDSLRSIISASSNTFMNSLSTNFGMSNASHSALQPYIPAILYTLYDGYYIYAPTRTPVVCSDSTGKVVYVGDPGVSEIGTVVGDDGETYRTYHFYQPTQDPETGEMHYYNSKTGAEVVGPFSVFANNEEVGMLMYKLEEGNVDDPTYVASIIEPTSSSGAYTKFNTDYVLKSYVPYAARYAPEGENIDVVVNYTLDNYINIYGYINDIYYSKSGYLMDISLLEDASGNITTNHPEMFDVSDTEIFDYVSGLGGAATLTLHVPNKDGGRTNIVIPSTTNAGCMAIAYYVSAYNFSNWVYDELGTLNNESVREYISQINNEAYRNSLDEENAGYSLVVDFSRNPDQLIFNRSQNPDLPDSDFALHKYNVIKNSIQFNLNLSMSEYNQMSATTFDFEMPVISEDDWDRITSRVTIATFMQGLSVGLKTYSNYCVVSSTNNEFTVIPDQLYYVNKPTTDESNIIYHKIDCPEFNVPSSQAEVRNHIGDYESFISKEVKYDKVYDKNLATNVYDHKYYGCYYCAVNANYEKDVVRPDTGELITAYNSNLDPRALSEGRMLLYYMTLAKERYKIYKSNSIENSQGFEILIPDAARSQGDISGNYDFYENGRQNNGGLVFGNDNIGVVIGFEHSSAKNISEIKAVEIVVANTKSSDDRSVGVPVVATSVYINGGTAGAGGTPAYNPNDYVEESGTRIGLYNLTNYVANQQTIRVDFKDTLDIYSGIGNSKLNRLYLGFRDRANLGTTTNMGFVLKEVRIIYK